MYNPAGSALEDGTAVLQPVLDVRNLTVTYRTDKGPLDIVRNVSLQVAPGEIYGLVGESGSGKTTLARAVVRYLAANGSLTADTLKLGDTDLLTLSRAEMRKVWGSRITMVHQDPGAAVNPSIPVGEQIAEVARVHLHLSPGEARKKALEMLGLVRMPDPESVARRYAHQLSGGMLQRVLIATAMATNPELMIMDEPTTALDVTTEAVILDLLNELMTDYNTAILYITHNLGVVARICSRIGVMYAGEIMEEGPVKKVFRSRLHPYTRGLLGSVPRVDASKKDVHLKAITGQIPRPEELPEGCIFSPRCELAEGDCLIARPPLVQADGDHYTACRRWQELLHLKEKEQHEGPVRGAYDSAKGPLVLEAREIKKHFRSSGGLSSLFSRESGPIKAVDDMSVRLRGGFTMGIVGESGCGKTTFARCLAGLEEATSGEIALEGVTLPYSVNRRKQSDLKKIQMVFQNPDASLNPQHQAGVSVARPLILLGGMNRSEVRSRVRELFRAVNLPEDYIYRLPHELSGGEKQRVAIARAFAADPILMLCDEPISALDVSVQASLINLLAELQEKNETAYLFISHDLAAVRHISDWIAVVYLGRLWEVGSADDVFVPPYHPYTEALLSAIPVPDPEVSQEQIRLRGSVPSAVNIPSGCRFHTRCPRKIGPICEEKEPPWQESGFHHKICCHIPLPRLKEMQGKGCFFNSSAEGEEC